jgi:RNA polymerase subunit RPABC4/transcription elongation factor Spt4
MASNLTDSWVEYRTEIPFLENNGTDFISGYWNLKDIGINTLRIIVDPENDIREFDEGNNILTLQLDVEEAPDISIEVIREGDQYNSDTGQFDMTQGEEYEISFLIQNHGNYSFEDLSIEYTGPVRAPSRSINLDAYQQQRVTFTIKPEVDAGQVAVWKCTVNDDDKFFESDDTNNEAPSVINVMEPEPESMMWVLFLFIIALLVIGVIIAGYFIYTKMKTKDMAKCSNCGGLVSIDETICPHCGVEFSDELECECGEIIPTGAAECPSCGRPVAGEVVGPVEEGEEGEEEEEETEGEIEELGEVSEEAPEEIEEIEEVAEEAPEVSSEEEELAECFECGALIPVSAPICPHCGAVFE